MAYLNIFVAVCKMRIKFYLFIFLPKFTHRFSERGFFFGRGVLSPIKLIRFLLKIIFFNSFETLR